jgi:hypothetical protein
MKALINHVFLEDLASHGWVVAAIDPAYNAPVRFPDGRVLGTLQPAEQGWAELSGDKHDEGARVDYIHVQRVMHWSRDVSFVIDRLTALDCEAGSFFRRLDLQRGVGVFGVSLGGNAAGTARLLDSRVRAAINLDGYGPDGPYSPVKGPDMGEQPFLWILRQGPRAATWYPDRLLQPIAKGALRVVLDRPGFTHGDFSDEAIWGAFARRGCAAMGPNFFREDQQREAAVCAGNSR